jgi:hypothetical protein
MMYDTDSYLRGLDNGNRRCAIRIGSVNAKIIISLFSGIIIGSAVTLEAVSFYVH